MSEDICQAWSVLFLKYEQQTKAKLNRQTDLDRETTEL